MANKIFKYSIKLVGEQFVDMPNGAKILCVKKQKQSIPDTENQFFKDVHIWALVNTDAGISRIKIIIHETGIEVDTDKQAYLDTIEVDGIVYHVFQGKNC